MNGRFTARPVRNTPRKLHDYIWAIPWVFNESLAYAPRDCFSMQNLTEFGVDEDRMGPVATPTITKSRRSWVTRATAVARRRCLRILSCCGKPQAGVDYTGSQISRSRPVLSRGCFRQNRRMAT